MDGSGAVDRIDHDEIALPHAEHALRREDDLVPARRNILGGQGRAIGEFDAVADLEGPGSAAIGRLRHRRAHVADDVVGLARIVRIGANQRAVERRRRMDRRVGLLAMRVKARRRVGRDHVGQGSTVFRGLFVLPGRSGKRRRPEHCGQRYCLNVHCLPPVSTKPYYAILLRRSHESGNPGPALHRPWTPRASRERRNRISLLFIQPNPRQVLIDEMGRGDLPAFDIRAIRHDPVPPQ